MDFKDIVEQRYAVKMFDGRKIPDEKVKELLELVRLSASSYGLQPFVVKIIKGITLKQKIQECSFNQSQITSCSHLLVFCARPDVFGQLNKYKDLMKKKGVPESGVFRFGAMIEKVFDGIGPEEEVEWAKHQVYLAIGNAMNGAKELGFDSCPMEGFKPREVSKILDLEKEGLVPTLLLPIGYSAKPANPKIRFSTEDLFEWVD